MSDSSSDLNFAADTIARMTTWRVRAVAGALVLALAGVCGLVWTSPRTPGAVAEGSNADQLAAENARLRSELADANERAEENRIAAKAATEREEGLRRGQTKAAAERAAAAAEQELADQARGVSDRENARQRGAARAHAEQAAAQARDEAANARAKTAQTAQAAEELRAQLAQARARVKVIRVPVAAPVKPTVPVPLVVPTKAQILAGAAGGARWFGFYTEQAPFNWGTYDAVEAKAQRNTTLTGYFQGWDGQFRPDAVERSWRHGELPIMTWESRPLAAGNNDSTEPDYTAAVILSGRYDNYLRKYARDIVDLGLPMGIRLNHEMNGTWYPWSDGINGNKPGDYVRVWRHVHDIFEQEGANKYVVWVWGPNIVNKLYRERATLAYTRSQYPGDAYVDWMGLSGYSRPQYSADYRPTFDYTYGKTLTQLRAVSDKPIILAEVGASEVGGYKPAWVKDFFAGLQRPANADVIGFVWFNLAITTISGGERVTNDWRIDSRSDTLAAFRTGLNAPASSFDPLPKP